MSWKIWVALMIVAFLLISGWLTYALLGTFPGNPISFLIAKISTKSYIAQHHPNSDYKIQNTWYNDRDDHYCVRIYSDASPDSSYTIEFDAYGLAIRNSYKVDVEHKFNTARRLSDEYEAKVTEILAYAANIHISPGCALRWTSRTGPNHSHYIVADKLELNGVYDLGELGAYAGYIEITVEVESPEELTVANLAETLLSIREALDQANLPFHTITCTLKYQDGSYSKSMVVQNLLYEIISQEDLEDQLYIRNN